MQRKSKQTTFEQPIPLVMSPLADPVVGAIFSSMEQAGLAAESLVGSILREEGYTLGQITNVVPQRYYKAYPDMRGCRVDIFVDTLEGKKAIVEVQLAAEPILIRNLFEVSQMIAAAIPLGTDVKELKDHMPHIIVINILNFDLRKDHQDYIQPVGFLYTKSPHTIAEDHIRIFNVQLPRFREQTHDLKKPLDAWLYLLDTAHQKKVSLKEVIAMEPILQETIDLDAGLKQFTEGYDKAAADPEVQEEYRKYYSEILRMEG
ncbi:MAG: Rpn family recombination-promoting nuclease/putative transposase, partial [Lachnospiraceae bacterium]|nr:Rpn family recombination-promoting nuclease/putative transposase [Lachnospiraceae bacterium]